MLTVNQLQVELKKYNDSQKTNRDLKFLLLNLDKSKSWENTVNECFDTSNLFPKRLEEVIKLGFKLGTKIRITLTNNKTVSFEEIITGYVWGSEDICFITNKSTNKGYSYLNCRVI